jgi:hypothetical protein
MVVFVALFRFVSGGYRVRQIGRRVRHLFDATKKPLKMFENGLTAPLVCEGCSHAKANYGGPNGQGRYPAE